MFNILCMSYIVHVYMYVQTFSTAYAVVCTLLEPWANSFSKRETAVVQSPFNDLLFRLQYWRGGEEGRVGGMGKEVVERGTYTDMASLTSLSTNMLLLTVHRPGSAAMANSSSFRGVNEVGVVCSSRVVQLKHDDMFSNETNNFLIVSNFCKQHRV